MGIGIFQIVFLVVLVLSFAVLWQIEKQVRSWQQPNWTTPTRKTAPSVILTALLPNFFLAATALIVILGTSDTVDGRSAPPALAALTFIPAALAMWGGIGLATLRSRNKPVDAVVFKSVKTKFPDESPGDNTWRERSNTLWLASQTVFSQGQAAHILGIPPLLIHATRAALFAAFTVLMFIGPMSWV